MTPGTLSRHELRRWRWLVLGVGLSCGCQGARWVIGTPLEEPGDAGLGLDASGVVSCFVPEDTLEPDPEGMLPGPDQVGRWSAFLSGDEAAHFSAPRLELTLAADGAGRLRFESPSAPAPAVDASVGYLCSAPGASTCTPSGGFVPGFEYALKRVSARGSILSFRALLDDPWDGWCALQKPVEQRTPGCPAHYDIEPSYLAPVWAETCSVLRAEGRVDIDCGRLATVERKPCACTARACSASRSRSLDVYLRLVAPGVFEGALWFERERALVVQLERLADAQ
jgi:hypothetical protein